MVDPEEVVENEQEARGVELSLALVLTAILGVTALITLGKYATSKADAGD